MTEPLEVHFKLDAGFTVHLDVECNVSGCYKPARINGDPDTCYEEEHPDVEPVSATVRDEEEDTATEQPFDLTQLSSAEHGRLLDALHHSLHASYLRRWDYDN